MKTNVLPVLLAARRAHKDKDTEGAQRLYRQVLASDPANAQAARELGFLLADSGRHRDAASVLAPAAKAHPRDAELQARLGRCLFLAGQPKSAVAWLEQALSLNPNSRSARAWLADCRMASFRPKEALALLEPVLKQSPDAFALGLAGRACMVTGRFREGLDHLRAALALGHDEDLHGALAWALLRSGRQQEALAEFDAALARSPDSPSLLAGKSKTLDSLGDREGARRVLEPAIERGVLNADLAMAYARTCKGKEHRARAIDAAERTLAAMEPGAPQRDALLFALATLLDAAGDYDRAFACFRESNDMCPLRFDGAAHERSMQGIRDVFSAENLARLPRASFSDPLPVFIVGMPRSGTSLVEQIIASHPAVHGAGELYELSHMALDIPRLLGLPPSPGFPACALALETAQLDRLARRHLDRLRELGPGAQRVTDKMPHNFPYLGLVELLFPAARIVHCVRNPLDTCLSCYTTELDVQHSYKYRLADLGAAYRSYRAIMDHWRAVLTTPILDIRYEDLITDTEASVRRLIDFVGLEWDDRCLRPHENRRVVNTASIDQVRQPIYDSSINRWKKYERHLGELIDGLRDLL